MSKPEPELMERAMPATTSTPCPSLLRAEIDGAIATARALPAQPGQLP